MILTLDKLKKYLPLNSITDGAKYEAFELRALFKYLPKYLGDELVETLASIATPWTDSSVGLDPDSAPVEALLLKLEPVLANLTLLESIPQFNLVSTGAGFGVVSNPNQAPASVERVRDLKDSCLQAANDGLDRLLYFLETNVDTYPTWNKSCINTGSLISDVTLFDQFIDISCSRRKFVDLKRHINFEESTTFMQVFSSEFLTVLKAGSDTNVKTLVIQTLAWYAEIAYQKANNPEANISALIGRASTLMSVTLSHLRTHLTDYPEYSDYAYETPYDNAIDGEESGFFIGGITG